MPFQTYRFHEFRGQSLSLRDIARITGISRWTLRARLKRGVALDAPLPAKRPKVKPKRPHLSGDRDRDVEMIVRWMHGRLAKRG